LADDLGGPLHRQHLAQSANGWQARNWHTYEKAQISAENAFGTVSAMSPATPLRR
jgi:hypothetical protein